MRNCASFTYECIIMSVFQQKLFVLVSLSLCLYVRKYGKGEKGGSYWVPRESVQIHLFCAHSQLVITENTGDEN